MSGLEALGRVVPSVLLLVVVLLAVRWWAKRGGGGGTAPVRVLARTGITKGAMLAVVAVEGRRLLVGASEQGVNLLLQLGPDRGVDAVTDAGVIDGDMDVLAERWSSEDLSHAMLGDDQTRPGIGLVDRLRQMTVRQPGAARPIRPFRVPRS